MRWTRGEDSSNVEDRRSEGGGMGRRVGLGGGAVLLVLSLVFGRNLFEDLGVSSVGSAGDVAPGAAAAPNSAQSAAEKDLVEFVTFVLNDEQAIWGKVLAGSNAPYHDAKLVLFRNATRSGCGTAESAMGPFYCPVDERVYVDLGFYDELRRRFGASGDFAQAYVIAHELGHHVQNILGIESRVRQQQAAQPGRENQLSVLMELQADCFAGVWGHSTDERKLLDSGDASEALGAAAAVGDDRVQQQSRGGVRPESFTHGSSALRAQWFQRGFKSGSVSACDTFGGGQ